MNSESHKKNAILLTSSILKKISRSLSDNVNSATAVASTLSEKPFAESKRKRVIDLFIKSVSSYSAKLISVFDKSSWNSYKQNLSLKLSDSVAVVYKISATKELFIIRSISESDVKKKLFMLHWLQHKNLLFSYELYFFKDEILIVSELVTISLEKLTVACSDKVQLAAIIS